MNIVRLVNTRNVQEMVALESFQQLAWIQYEWEKSRQSAL